MSSRCHCCLSTEDEVLLQDYTLKTASLRNIFQTDCLLLCYICGKVAEKAEIFIVNVQNNQDWIEKSSNSVFKSILEDMRLKNCPIINLSIETPSIQSIIEIKEKDESTAKEIKSELEEEDFNELTKLPDLLSEKDKNNDDIEELIEDIKHEKVEEDCFDADLEVKEEDDYPLKLPIEELESEGKKLRKQLEIENESYTQNNSKKVETLNISEQECLEERAQKLLDPNYYNSSFKCEDCVKGFEFELSYKNHMEFHSENKGDYECKICKCRVASHAYLLRHLKKVHFTRYRCAACGLTRTKKRSVENHFLEQHAHCEFVCHLCGKIFKRKNLLKSHLDIHNQREKMQCDHCDKSYLTKTALRSHLKRIHGSVAGQRAAMYMCEECGAAFSSPSQLKVHERVHDDRKNFYCVECDKSFKTEYSLNYHLKLTRSHANYSDLPLSCGHCEKRFAVKRDLERHVNRIHLNIKPFKCDQCNKGYMNNWSLREHQRLTHEGYKRPLKYPCTMCDKVFRRGHILKSHIRTHTGERPYQCSRCPAQFSQAGILNTHVKLIHLKLTRDGRPKNGVVK